MGLLAQAKVEECSATDMIGQYVGQTGPKVQLLLEKALGKVLFIDEAYRLAEGGYATEAMDELVDCLTKPKFAQKLVTILAGYDEDMNRLMSINPGLTSRFPESVIFKHMEPGTCLDLLTKSLQRKKGAPLDLSVLIPPSEDLRRSMIDLFQRLSELKSWGNARDVKSLAKSMFGKLISTAVPPVTSLVLTEGIIIEAMENMLEERSRRSEAVGTTRNVPIFHPTQISQQQQQHVADVHTPKITTNSNISPPEASPDQQKPQHQDMKQVEEVDAHLQLPKDPNRDAGVADAVWHQLELDKQTTAAREKEYHQLQEEKIREEQRVAELKRAEKAAAEEEERRRLEEERMRLELERIKRMEELAALERARQKEMEVQKRLRNLGVCPVGFQWIKQGHGYRCAGGSHFVGNHQLGL